MACPKLQHLCLIKLSAIFFLIFTSVHATERHYNSNWIIKNVNDVLGIEHSEKADDIIPFNTLPPEEKICTDFTLIFFWRYHKGI